jgi:hypothetical protein
MRLLPLKTIFLHNALLKTMSIIIGYSLWSIATHNQTIEKTFIIPLCFSSNQIIDAPETISVTLACKRKDMYTLATDSLAAHITIDKLLPGKYGILLTERQLFLPGTIKLVRYSPSNLSFSIKEYNVT